MSYVRTLELHCDNCDAQVVVKHPAGSKAATQSTSVADGVRLTLSQGWTALTMRSELGEFRTFRTPAELREVPRGFTLLCPTCDGRRLPPYSPAAQRALAAADEAERTVIERLDRIESTLAALTGLAEAVRS